MWKAMSPRGWATRVNPLVKAVVDECCLWSIRKLMSYAGIGFSLSALVLARGAAGADADDLEDSGGDDAAPQCELREREFH